MIDVNFGIICSIFPVFECVYDMNLGLFEYLVMLKCLACVFVELFDTADELNICFCNKLLGFFFYTVYQIMLQEQVRLYILN